MAENIPNYLSNQIVNDLFSVWSEDGESNIKDYAYRIFEAFMAGQQILISKIANGEIVQKDVYKIESSNGKFMKAVSQSGEKREFVLTHLKEPQKLIIAAVDEIEKAMSAKDDKVRFNHSWMFTIAA